MEKCSANSEVSHWRSAFYGQHDKGGLNVSELKVQPLYHLIKEHLDNLAVFLYSPCVLDCREKKTWLHVDELV